MARRLSLDIETYSSVDLKKYGVYAYTEAPDFEILIFAWAFDDEPVQSIEMPIKYYWDLPIEVCAALTDPDVVKFARNAPFEITCIERALSITLDPKQWRCTAVIASELGLPRDLFNLSRQLKIQEEKLGIGTKLISYFCKPCKPTKANGGRTRNLPEHDEAAWMAFVLYCERDVEAERVIEKKLEAAWIDENEWTIWALDQEINRRGVGVDMALVDRAMAIGEEMKIALMSEARKLTGLSNPNSVKQLATWLSKETDTEIEGLKKADVAALLGTTDDDTVTRVLEIRQQLGKTSTAKYGALKGATCRDGRIRGTLLFYGASRTGRWAGRIFQPQNLPQNKMKDIDAVRDVVLKADFSLMETIYDNGVADILSQLIRTAIVPREGKKFIVADFSAVEARALAWIAGEEWRLEVFRTHGKIYEASASAAFHVPLEEITKDSPLRQQGKVLELACGYGGSVGAIDAMDYNKAIPEDERKSMVQAWRAASPNIVSFWWAMGDAAMTAVENPGKAYKVNEYVSFKREKGFLFMYLPSGRRLAYPKPEIAEGKYGPQVTYLGEDQYTKKWGRISTYGPKLVENLIQAVCRDLLAYGMLEVKKEGYDIVLHVHDEAVIECDMDVEVHEIETILARKPPWADGMPHVADGFETMFYKK